MGKVREDMEELLINCQCSREILGITYLPDFNEFSIRVLRDYTFKKKQEVSEIIITPKDAEKIIEYLLKKMQAPSSIWNYVMDQLNLLRRNVP